MLKAILWDWNGVIIDDLDAIARSNCTIIEEFTGNKVSVERWFKEVRQDWHTFFLNNGVKHEDLHKILPLMDKHYSKYLDLIHLSENAPEILEKLSKKYKMGILSGADKKSIHNGLKRYKIDHLFDFVISGEDVVKEKPHPEGLITSLKKFNLKGEEVIYVDDMPVIFKPAKKLGFRIIGFKSRISNGELEGAEYVVDTFNEIEKVIEKLK